jgi:hypothetical protein
MITSAENCLLEADFCLFSQELVSRSRRRTMKQFERCVLMFIRRIFRIDVENKKI